MRIGFDADVLTTGKTAAAQYLAKLVEHLVRANPRLEIVLFSSDKICVDYEPSTHFPQVERVVEFLPRERRKDVWPAHVLPRLLKAHAIDVFHAPVRDSLPFFRPPCPTVLTVFDMAPWIMHDPARGLFGLWNYRLRHWGWSRMADRIITLTETGKKDIMRFCRVSPESVTVTPMGCDEEPSPGMSSDEEEKILKKYKLEGKTYLLSVSGLDRSRRNPDFLLEAFSQCHRFLPDDLYFVFTGHNYPSRGQYDRTLRKLDMLGIKDKVVVTGFVHDRTFQALMANAAVSVITPFYTGMPLAVLDSFACGVPVVASDRGAIPEIAKDAAILVDPYDASAIAGAIRRLLEDPNEHEKYAEQGLLRSREHSWDKMADETLKVYQQISIAR